MAGLTENGLTIRTQPELQALLEDAVTSAFPGANVQAGPLHQIIGALSEELAIAWETLQAVYAAAYPDSANGVLLDWVAGITGTTRRAATRTRVVGAVTLAAETTLAAGAVAAVAGLPDRQFRTVAAVTNASASQAMVDVELEALVAGPVPVPAGSLTVIVTPRPGWVAITNPSAGDTGLDVETDAELRTRRLVELAGSGRRTYDAIRAAVVRADEAHIEDVSIYGNETLSTDSAGRPPKSFEVVVWDGDPAGADDDVIAQAIWDTKPEGIVAHGDGSSGVATDEAGVDHAVAFTRAAPLLAHVRLRAILTTDAGAGWQAQAAAVIAERGDAYRVGQTAYASQLVAAVLDAVPAIEAIAELTVGTTPSPTSSSVAASYDEIVRFDASRVVAEVA